MAPVERVVKVRAQPRNMIIGLRCCIADITKKWMIGCGES